MFESCFAINMVQRDAFPPACMRRLEEEVTTSIAIVLSFRESFRLISISHTSYLEYQPCKHNIVFFASINREYLADRGPAVWNKEIRLPPRQRAKRTTPLSLRGSLIKARPLQSSTISMASHTRLPVLFDNPRLLDRLIASRLSVTQSRA